jgi:hypothetical protein
MRQIAIDSVAGDSFGVVGTPTLLINGLCIMGFPGRVALERAVADALGLPVSTRKSSL